MTNSPDSTDDTATAAAPPDGATSAAAPSSGGTADDATISQTLEDAEGGIEGSTLDAPET
jgi:hypothetical protein